MAGSIRYRGGRLYPPGKRGRVWYWRGAIDGTRHEFSTGTGDREEAKRVVREAFQSRARERDHVPVTFADVADMYMQSRQSSEQERRFIARLVEVAGEKPIAAIRQGDMTPVIQRFYSTAKPATVNRQVFTPYAAITHYAADMDLCPYKRVRKMQVEDTFRIAAPNELGRLLLANTEGHKRAYCAMLYIQGWRQSDARRLEWPHIDLTGLTFTTVIPKSRKLKAVPMDPVVRDALAVLPVTDGRVFPWPSRDAVRRWWKPLVESLGYPGVTPHQFRHAWGWDARAEKATDGDMVDANTWTNPRSTHAYTRTPSEHARSILGKIGGRKPK